MRRNLFKKSFVLFSLIVLATGVLFFSLNMKSASAQGIVPCGSPGQGECTLCHLVIGFQNIMQFFLGLLFITTMLFITIAGVLYMVSSGNKSLMDWAKNALTYSLTGFVLLLCSWLIVTTILLALGYKQAGNWWTFTC